MGYIQNGSDVRTIGEHLAEICFIDQRAARGVNEGGTLWHGVEERTVDHFFSLRQPRRVQAHHMALRKKLLQGNQCNAKRSGGGRTHKRIVGEDSDFVFCQMAGNEFSDGAQGNEADRGTECATPFSPSQTGSPVYSPP